MRKMYDYFGMTLTPQTESAISPQIHPGRIWFDKRRSQSGIQGIRRADVKKNKNRRYHLRKHSLS